MSEACVPAWLLAALAAAPGAPAAAGRAVRHARREAAQDDG